MHNSHVRVAASAITSRLQAACRDAVYCSDLCMAAWPVPDLSWCVFTMAAMSVALVSRSHWWGHQQSSKSWLLHALLAAVGPTPAGGMLGRRHWFQRGQAFSATSCSQRVVSSAASGLPSRPRASAACAGPGPGLVTQRPAAANPRQQQEPASMIGPRGGMSTWEPHQSRDHG